MAGSGTVVLSRVDRSGTDPIGVRKLTFTWVGDSAAGTMPAVPISANQAKVLEGLKAVLATTNPGTPAPDDNYSITITDADGVDIFDGALASRSTSVSQQCRPTLATTAGKRLVDGVLTFNVTGNATASATGVCKVYFTK